jgi:hypothetical protein
VANDFNLEEFKLKDPVSNIDDGLKEPVKDSTPGFFQSLKKSNRSYGEKNHYLHHCINGSQVTLKRNKLKKHYDYLRQQSTRTRF